VKYLIQELTQKNLKKIWEGNFPRCNYTTEQIQYNFELKLFQYAAGRMYDLDFSPDITSAYRQESDEDTSRSKQFQRLLLGYYGLPFTLTPFRSGLSSKRANLKQSKSTSDHIIGVTLTGQYVKNELDKRVNDNYKNLNSKDLQMAIKDMSHDFLPNHLWLWATCRITRSEHKAENLERGDNAPEGKNPLKYKANFEHYKKAKFPIEVEAYK